MQGIISFFSEKKALGIGFWACNCLFGSCNFLLTSLILGRCYRLNWPKRANSVYWLCGTFLYPRSLGELSWASLWVWPMWGWTLPHKEGGGYSQWKVAGEDQWTFQASVIDLSDYQFENPCPPNLRQVSLILHLLTFAASTWPSLYWTLWTSATGSGHCDRWYWPI